MNTKRLLNVSLWSPAQTWVESVNTHVWRRERGMSLVGSRDITTTYLEAGWEHFGRTVEMFHLGHDSTQQERLNLSWKRTNQQNTVWLERHWKSPKVAQRTSVSENAWLSQIKADLMQFNSQCTFSKDRAFTTKELRHDLLSCYSWNSLPSCLSPTLLIRLSPINFAN